MAEAHDLKSFECGFESHRGYFRYFDSRARALRALRSLRDLTTL